MGTQAHIVVKNRDGSVDDCSCHCSLSEHLRKREKEDALWLENNREAVTAVIDAFADSDSFSTLDGMVRHGFNVLRYELGLPVVPDDYAERRVRGVAELFTALEYYKAQPAILEKVAKLRESMNNRHAPDGV